MSGGVHSVPSKPRERVSQTPELLTRGLGRETPGDVPDKENVLRAEGNKQKNSRRFRRDSVLKTKGDTRDAQQTEQGIRHRAGIDIPEGIG